MAKIISIHVGDISITASVMGRHGPVIIPTGVTTISELIFSSSHRHSAEQYNVTKDTDVSSNMKGGVDTYRQLLGNDRKVATEEERLNTINIISGYFETIKKDVESFLSYPAYEAILVIPSNTTRLQRLDIALAAENAGWRVRRTIYEVEAIALNYSYDFQDQLLETEKKCLIVHFDHNSFSIGIFELDDGIVETKGVHGSKQLSISIIEKRLTDYCIEKFESESTVRFVHSNYKILLSKVKLALNCLGSQESFRIQLPKNEKGTSIHEIFTIDLLNQICEIEFETLEQSINDLLKRCGLSIDDINLVIVEYGSNMNSFLRDSPKLKLGKAKLQISPYGAVYGGALQGAILTGDAKNLLCLNATNYGLGIMSEGRKCYYLICMDTIIPTKAAETFIVKAKGKNLQFHIFEGNSDQCDNNDFIGTLLIAAPQSVDDQEIGIELTFDLDANLTFNVSGISKTDHTLKAYGRFPSTYALPPSSTLTSGVIRNW